MQTTSRRCFHCGEPNPSDGLYCFRCGRPLSLGGPLQPFSVGLLVFLHYITLGIFSEIWLNLYHGKMPKRRPDDPSAGRAVGFLFIPFYGLYWIFFTHLRLCDRLNQERAQAGLVPNAPRSLALWCCIIWVIPYVGFLTYLVLYPVLAAMLQSGFNELALLRPGGLALGQQAAFAPHAGPVCSFCRAGNPPGAAFCSSCGAGLASTWHP